MKYNTVHERVSVIVIVDKNMHFARVLLSLLFDYFRWTQLVPMILVWSMMIAMSFVLLLVYNEDAAWSLAELGITTVQSLPFIGDRFELWMESQTVDGVFSPDLGAIDFKELTLKTWAWLSLGFMLLGAFLRKWIGPLPPFTLKRKLALAGAASGVVSAGFAMLYFIYEVGRGGQLLAVLTSATGMGLALFVISAWCLTISHTLGILSRVVMEPGFQRGETDSTS